VDGNVGSDGLLVSLPGSVSSQNVTLALMHGTDLIATGEMPFEYLECAAGQYKGVDEATLAVSCVVCPKDSYCVSNRLYPCPGGTHTDDVGAIKCVANADSAATIVIAVLGSIVGVIFFGGLYVGGKKFYKQYKAALLAQKENHEAKLKRLATAAKGVTSVNFSVCFVPFQQFEKHEKLLNHEEVRQRGDIITLDTYEHVLAFSAKFPTMFISHQWLGVHEPDPNNRHYRAMVAGIKAMCIKHKIPEESLFIWVDYMSIPQVNPKLRELSISSLAVYSSVLQYFLIIAPNCIHYDKQIKVDTDTYQKRGWCRMEQWARMTVGGLEGMFMFDEVELKPLKDPKWFMDSIHVFEGDFTDPADKQKLVDTSIGLWAHTMMEHQNLLTSSTKRDQGPDETVYSLIQQHKSTVFPKAYFGDLVDMLESNLPYVAEQQKVGKDGKGMDGDILFPHELLFLSEGSSPNRKLTLKRDSTVFALHAMIRANTANVTADLDA